MKDEEYNLEGEGIWYDAERNEIYKAHFTKYGEIIKGEPIIRKPASTPRYDQFPLELKFFIIPKKKDYSLLEAQRIFRERITGESTDVRIYLARKAAKKVCSSICARTLIEKYIDQTHDDFMIHCGVDWGIPDWEPKTDMDVAFRMSLMASPLMQKRRQGTSWVEKMKSERIENSTMTIQTYFTPTQQPIIDKWGSFTYDMPPLPQRNCVFGVDPYCPVKKHRTFRQVCNYIKSGQYYRDRIYEHIISTRRRTPHFYYPLIRKTPL